MPLHARRVNAMTPDAVDYVLHYFGARTGPRKMEAGWLPSVSLAEVDAGQADVVLSLLRSGEQNFLEQAESVVGHQIVRCPPALRILAPMRATEAPDDDSPDLRRVLHVCRHNPRKGRTGAASRFDMLRAGMTLQQFYVRGGTRRDARMAVANGWIRVSA